MHRGHKEPGETGLENRQAFLKGSWTQAATLKPGHHKHCLGFWVMLFLSLKGHGPQPANLQLIKANYCDINWPPTLKVRRLCSIQFLRSPCI